VSAWVAVLSAALAAVMAVPPRARWPTPPVTAAPVASYAEDVGWMRRGRGLWSVLAGAGAAAFVSGGWGAAVGVGAAIATWWWIGRAEPVSTRRQREAAERELPSVVHLLATALESGCDVARALDLVTDALPGPAAGLLGTVPARLALGVAADAAWRPVLDNPELAPLGRAMVRAHRSGAPVTDEVARLADELDRRTRARVEDRARAVGVKAALPLGLCLLPSFLFLGVVPLVAGLLRSLSW
jgi:type II secretion system (T2SS) protein F